MLRVLDHLQLVLATDVLLHETHEPSRLADTARLIEQEGFLRHPPLGVALGDGRYMVIDGAHRTASLRAIGCPFLPLQVVPHTSLQIESWDHHVPVGAWWHSVLEHPALCWLPSEQVPLVEMEPLVTVQTETARLAAYPASAALDTPEQRLALWHQIVETYSDTMTVERLPQGTRVQPAPGSLLLHNPRHSLARLIEIVQRGQVLPAGVTRFLIAGRLLNLRVPLDLLRAEEAPGRLWHELLEHWQSSLRLYTEAVYVCEA